MDASRKHAPCPEGNVAIGRRCSRPAQGRWTCSGVLGRLELGSEEQVVRFLGIMQAVVKQPLIKVNYLFL